MLFRLRFFASAADDDVSSFEEGLAKVSLDTMRPLSTYTGVLLRLSNAVLLKVAKLTCSDPTCIPLLSDTV